MVLNVSQNAKLHTSCKTSKDKAHDSHWSASERELFLKNARAMQAKVKQRLANRSPQFDLATPPRRACG